jgi:hypothetical protein
MPVAAKRPASLPLLAQMIPESVAVAPRCHSTFGSRLSSDMAGFVAAVDAEALRLRDFKLAAVAATRRELQALWPRAQVHLYGSFVYELSLPCSDVDLVITLPRVQSLAPAQAPGDLEVVLLYSPIPSAHPRAASPLRSSLQGRNAIKETWQQNLSRTLRASSWVEPSSIKSLSKTAIPIMKLSTVKSGAVFERAYDLRKGAGKVLVIIVFQLLLP